MPTPRHFICSAKFDFGSSSDLKQHTAKYHPHWDDERDNRHGEFSFATPSLRGESALNYSVRLRQITWRPEARICSLGDQLWVKSSNCWLSHPSRNVLAVPDTGAERNVIDMDYALEKGLEIKRNHEKQYLGFADGTCQETEGRVDTHWTFTSGERIPITFEVLKYCCSDVIIGEEVLTEHNVFEDHTSSIIATPCGNNIHPLAPFDFVRAWQRPLDKINQKLSRKSRASDFQGNSDESANRQAPNRGGVQAKEQRRRNMWNYKYDFGATATTVEKDLERLRREHYAFGLAGAVGHQQGNNESRQVSNAGASDRRHPPVIPSITAAPSRR
ncbi:MAG: hypothetical protein Q9203_006634 [Teloschistes exilis]